MHITLSDLLVSVEASVNPITVPAAVVFNGHITGLAVTRSLGRRGVPVIALDRDPKGYALASRYVTTAGLCPNVLTDEAGFIDYLIALGRSLRLPAVLFPCNDEWVLTVNRYRADLEPYFLIPFSGPEIVEPILDKSLLYSRARTMQIPIPHTWEVIPDQSEQLANVLPFPCILKPTEQRSFYESFGDKVWRVEKPENFRQAILNSQNHTLLAQEIIGQGLSDFYSVCSYIGLDGKAHGTFVGRKLEQYPPEFGTGCLVASEQVQGIADQGVQILQSLNYRGISEVEFIYDSRDDTHKLLDINTRVWKWIGLPIAAGVDLPWLAYSDVTGNPFQAPKPENGLVWTYAKDYLALRLAGHGKGTAHYLPEAAWAELFAGRSAHVVDAVVDPSDPDPAARMIQNMLSPSPYFCAC